MMNKKNLNNLSFVQEETKKKWIQWKKSKIVTCVYRKEVGEVHKLRNNCNWVIIYNLFFEEKIYRWFMIKSLVFLCWRLLSKKIIKISKKKYKQEKMIRSVWKLVGL